MIYLASQSPRRQELLRQISVPFELLPVDIDESCLENESAEECVQRLALSKAKAAWECEQRQLDQAVMTADTIVVIDQQILGKPSSKQHAQEMLQSLSGQRHQVFSAVAMKQQKREAFKLSKTDVTFRELSDNEIAAYCNTDEPYDKAGAYAIQGFAATFITEIKGSYSGVMGLPLLETMELLREFAIQ